MSSHVREMAAAVARPLQKMNLQSLRSVDGIINLLQVLLGLAALFAACFIWQDTNVYIQFIYAGYGWQTLIDFIIFVTWLFALGIFISNIMEKSVYETFGKQRMLIAYGVCLVALIVSASLESWYCSLAYAAWHPIFHPRFVATCIFNWLLVVSYIALIVITAIFL